MKNVALALVLGTAILVGGLGIVGVATYVSYANKGVDFENGIKAVYDNNRTVLAQYSLKVKEAMGVTDAYTTDFTSVVEGAMEGRYGDDGVQSVLTFIQENYPGQFDSSLYVQVQRIIEAGRNDFQNQQTVLIDRCRVYNNNLDYVWSGFWLNLTGYPRNREELDEWCTPIQSEHSAKTFDTGIDTGIEIK